ncbi:hypothetical protein CMI47_00860 [Candidatus Pacearchaeota archaeon]|nr:hypothetical protein [Candidatus Pacearchaeota archaeon]
MTTDSLTSVASLVGCALLGLTPSFFSPPSATDPSPPPLEQPRVEAPQVDPEMRMVQEQSVRQILEVSELRSEIEDLHMLVAEQSPCPSCPR